MLHKGRPVNQTLFAQFTERKDDGVLPYTRKAKADTPTMLSEGYDFFDRNDATGWVLEQQAALTA